MYFSHHQSQPGSSNSKHHDGPPGPPNGLGAWGRHPFPPPGGPGAGMPLPSPAFGGPGGPGGPGQGPNGMSGYPPPPHHGHGPHHPSFGTGGAGGMHLQGAGQGMGLSYGMGLFGQGANGGASGGSPPRQESTVPMTQFWQHQLMRAEASRSSNSPHHRARTAAMASRMSNKPSAVTISDPNVRPNSAASGSGLTPAPNGIHKKNTSLSLLSHTTDRTETPPPAEANLTTNLTTGQQIDPATPAAIPAPQDKNGEEASEPWTGLDLGGIKLRTLSPAMFAFSHITSLYINHNALTAIPPAISALRQLTLSDATANEITSIPPELGILCKSKESLLFDNHISTSPVELGTLYNLETLGIDGNPVEERSKKISVEDGTPALIAHLRDNAGMGPSPPERQWIEVDPDEDSPEEGKQESFTVLSYNILCHHFAPGATYSYTPSWALDWNYRKQSISQEIINASADVVCSQEVDGEQFSDYFYPQLQEHGYEGSHYSRTRARTMSADEAGKVDGCATFWKDKRFQLVETQVVEFNQIALHKTDIRTDDMFNRVMSRDNIAVVAALEFKASGARLLVANSHIYWDHRYRDVKSVQIGMLMEELEKIVERFSMSPPKPSVESSEYNNGRGPPKYDKAEKGRDIPLVLCVDLNSSSGSAVHDFISNGRIAPDHEDFMAHTYGKYTAQGLSHSLKLRSACERFGEMKMTNFTPTFHAAIDYVFHTPRNLKVTSVLGDVEPSYLEKTVGFPNAHFPSDHIPIFVQFRVKGKTDPAPKRDVHHGFSK